VSYLSPAYGGSDVTIDVPTQWQGMAKLEFDIQIPNIVEQHNTFFIFLHLSKTKFHSKHDPFPLHQIYTEVTFFHFNFFVFYLLLVPMFIGNS
jgi:hypothetical protein